MGRFKDIDTARREDERLTRDLFDLFRGSRDRDQHASDCGSLRRDSAVAPASDGSAPPPNHHQAPAIASNRASAMAGKFTFLTLKTGKNLCFPFPFPTVRW